MNSSDKKLILNGIHLQYPSGLVALSDISLEIKAHSFITLLGPSGCGKSTLLKIIAGLLAPSSGNISNSFHPTGFVFQSPTLLSWRSLKANVGLPLEISGNSKMKQNEAIQQVLRLVKLTEFENAFPHQLSGGMKMRASIARALVGNPELLLMDEPFSALDDITRMDLIQDLENLWQKKRPTIIYVTHNLFEAAYLSQKIFVMSPRPGKIHAVFDVPFTFPRTIELRHDSEFNQFTEKLQASLKSSFQ